jgi:hypothetical protein
MAKGTKIVARFSDGAAIERTTTLGLTHAWRWYGLRDDKTQTGNSGFASSREKATAALNSDSGYVTKPSKWNNGKVGTLTFSEVVEVERVA